MLNSIKFLLFPFAICCCFELSAQEKTADSTRSENIEDVVVLGKGKKLQRSHKPLASVESYLESDNRINMIRRGSYAWEPILNGMTSERSLTTIDGMRIYGACTDKMDPITSYVEINNLSGAEIHSGQSGSAFGSTIAGSIDLVKNHSSFGDPKWKGLVMLGLESNNLLKVVGTQLKYASKIFYTDIDFTFRDALSYKAGNRTPVNNSQFRKYNTSGTVGLKINEHQSLKASAIYDLATNIGYPALPMDVSSAEAIITSLQYEWHHISKSIRHWENKLYFNQVTHIMDDSHRPNTIIQMDMPGWSSTTGFYSMMKGIFGDKHQWKANISGHYNYSLAEMTMFTDNPDEKEMFMVTWPGVETYYSNLFLEDKFKITDRWVMTATFANAIHSNNIKSNLGLNSLQIFYPEIQQRKTRWLPSANLSFELKARRIKNTMGVSYGERAPSISEGYGYYLFNSFDRYDYIGNPNLRNEKSWSLYYSTTYVFPFLTISRTVAYFGIFDYIIGIPANQLSPMTMGADGVRIYGQLDYVNMLNVDVKAKFKLHKSVQLEINAVYRKGFTMQLNRMPFIQPFGYGATLNYTNKFFTTYLNVTGAIKRKNYNADFGENATPAYAVINLSISRDYSFKNQTQLATKIGVENLLDSYYYTFADWNKIPRMGRNFFVNVIYNF